MQEFTLPIQQYCVSRMIDEAAAFGFPKEDVKVHLDYVIENMAYMMHMTFRSPVDVLQQERVIAEYPDGLWQHIKSVFTDNYRRKQVLLTEHLRFPEIAMPHPIGKDYKVYVHDAIRAYDPNEPVPEYF